MKMTLLAIVIVVTHMLLACVLGAVVVGVRQGLPKTGELIGANTALGGGNTKPDHSPVRQENCIDIEPADVQELTSATFVYGEYVVLRQICGSPLNLIVAKLGAHNVPIGYYDIPLESINWLLEYAPTMRIEKDVVYRVEMYFFNHPIYGTPVLYVGDTYDQAFWNREAQNTLVLFNEYYADLAIASEFMLINEHSCVEFSMNRQPLRHGSYANTYPIPLSGALITAIFPEECPSRELTQSRSVSVWVRPGDAVHYDRNRVLFAMPIKNQAPVRQNCDIFSHNWEPAWQTRSDNTDNVCWTIYSRNDRSTAATLNRIGFYRIEHCWPGESADGTRMSHTPFQAMYDVTTDRLPAFHWVTRDWGVFDVDVYTDVEILPREDLDPGHFTAFEAGEDAGDWLYTFYLTESWWTILLVPEQAWQDGSSPVDWDQIILLRMRTDCWGKLVLQKATWDR